MMYLFAKRCFDALFSGALLVILCPLLVVIGFVIRMDSRGPVIYRGVRTGLYGSEFYILKFRTMIDNAERLGGASTALNDARLTRVGRLLRRFKLDELPQLFNVLIGEMSLVGPRPQVPFYTRLYQGDELLILAAKPGITDLASLYFINMDQTLGDIDVDKKYFDEIEPLKNILRVQYVKQRGFLLDIRILIETFCRLFGLSNATRLNVTPFSTK